MKNYFGFTNASSFPLHEGQLFYWSIMKAVDSTKCRCTHSGRKGQVGGFQNPGVCLQAFPSFLPHPLPALLLVPFFCAVFDSRSLFFAPKPHGNVCYAGYSERGVFSKTPWEWGGGGGLGTPYDGLYGKAPPERDTIFRYQRVEISLAEVYER